MLANQIKHDPLFNSRITDPLFLTASSDHPLTYECAPLHEVRQTYLDRTETYNQSCKFEIKGSVILIGDSIDISWIMPAFNTASPSLSSVKNTGSYAFISEMSVDLSGTQIYSSQSDGLYYDDFEFRTVSEQLDLEYRSLVCLPLLMRQTLSESDTEYHLLVPLRRTQSDNNVNYPLFIVPNNKSLYITIKFRPYGEIVEGPTTNVQNITSLRLRYKWIETTKSTKTELMRHFFLPKQVMINNMPKSLRPMHQICVFPRIILKEVASGYSGNVTVDISTNATSKFYGLLVMTVSQADYQNFIYNNYTDDIFNVTEHEIRATNVTIQKWDNGFLQSKREQNEEGIDLNDNVLYIPLFKHTYYVHRNDHKAPRGEIQPIGETLHANFYLSAAASTDIYFVVKTLSKQKMEMIADNTGLKNIYMHL